MLVPEASAGCQCSYSIKATVVLQPTEEQRAWNLFYTQGNLTPVRHFAINLGASGDRRDSDGTLWLGYPRLPNHPRVRSKTVDFTINDRLLHGGGYFGLNPKSCRIRGTDTPWLFCCGCRGLAGCCVQLLPKTKAAVENEASPATRPARYTVRLGCAETDGAKPGQRVFDVQIQGKVVMENFDIVRTAGAHDTAVVKEFRDIQASDSLEIEFVPKTNPSDQKTTPLVSFLEVVKRET